MTSRQTERLARYESEYSDLKRRVGELGFVLVGTVQERTLTCGKPNCACHTAPENRHGPYHYWTRTVGGQSRGTLLTPAQARLYEQWVANGRKLAKHVRRMRALSAKAAALLAP